MANLGVMGAKRQPDCPGLPEDPSDTDTQASSKASQQKKLHRDLPSGPSMLGPLGCPAGFVAWPGMFSDKLHRLTVMKGLGKQCPASVDRNPTSESGIQIREKDRSTSSPNPLASQEHHQASSTEDVPQLRVLPERPAISGPWCYTFICRVDADH